MNSNFELVRANNDAAVAQIVMQRWLPQVQAPYVAAFSGGRVAVKFFQTLAAGAKGKLRQDGIHFFFADERCVPADHPESNFRLVNEHLIHTGTIAPEQVHRIPGEKNPNAAADEASRQMLEVCSGNLDMVFLGMGEDGHVASLFPGDRRMDAPEIYRPVVAPKPPPNRITLGLPAILRAKSAWVLASGTGKQAALEASLAPGGTTPLARVLAGRRGTLIVTDIR